MKDFDGKKRMKSGKRITSFYQQTAYSRTNQSSETILRQTKQTNNNKQANKTISLQKKNRSTSKQTNNTQINIQNPNKATMEQLL